MGIGIVMCFFSRLAFSREPREHERGARRASRWQPEQRCECWSPLRQREQLAGQWQLELRRRANPSTSPGMTAEAIPHAGHPESESYLAHPFPRFAGTEIHPTGTA